MNSSPRYCARFALLLLLALVAAPLCAFSAETGALAVRMRGKDIYNVLIELRTNGLSVVFLGTYPLDLKYPYEFSKDPIAARTLVEDLAAANNLKVTWVHGGAGAVLYAGVSDADVASIARDLQSADVVRRRDAARRSVGRNDPRLVPLIVKASRDPDLEVSCGAEAAWREWRLGAVLMLDPGALFLAEAELRSLGRQNSALWALQQCDRQTVEPLKADVEKIVTDGGTSSRNSAIGLLGIIGGEKVVALLERIIADEAYDRGGYSFRADATLALGRAGGEKVLPELELLLTDRWDYQVRANALTELARLGGERALPLLDRALLSTNESVSQAAVTALRDLGSDAAWALLEKSLLRGTEFTRKAAAEALVARDRGPKPHFSAPGAEPDALPENISEQALAELQQGLASADEETRRKAVQGLIAASIKNANARELLRKTLAGGDENLRVETASWLLREFRAETVTAELLETGDARVRDAIRSGERWPCVPCSAAFVERIMVHPDLHADAINGFQNMDIDRGDDPPRSTLLLAKALAIPDAKLNVAALARLRRDLSENALPLLEKALQRADPSVRAAAVGALATIGGAQATARVGQALHDTDATVRANAVRAIGESAEGNATALLEPALADPAAPVRVAAAIALGRRGNAKAVPVIEAVLAEPGELDYHGLFSALAKSGGATVMPWLEALFERSDDTVRSYLISALPAIGGDSIVPLLKKARTAPKFPFRNEAAERLRKDATLILLDTLSGADAVPLWKETLKDPDRWGVRRATTSALVREAKKGTGIDVFPLLKEAFDSAYPEIRDDAVSALAEIHTDAMLPLLAKSLEDSGLMNRDDVVEALGTAARDGGARGEHIMALMTRTLSCETAVARDRAVAVLRRSASEQAVTLCEIALADRTASVRHAAAECLGDWATTCPAVFRADPREATRAAVQQRAIAVLHRALQNPAEVIRGIARGMLDASR